MLRIKQRTSGVYVLTASAISDGGVAQVVSDPTIIVTDGSGAVIDSGTPIIDETTLTYALDATLLPHLDTYEVHWLGQIGGNDWSWTDTLEIVGGYLFEIADLRLLDTAFTDTTKYPSSLIAQTRIAVEQTMEGEKAGNVAFVPRGKRAKVDGTDKSYIILPDYEVREIYSLKINGVALTQDQLNALLLDDDRIYAVSGFFPKGKRNIEIHYEHGRDHAVYPISRAARLLAREYLVKSQVPGRATATSIGDQMYRITIAGRDGVTGLPEVDAAIEQHGRSKYRIG